MYLISNNAYKGGGGTPFLIYRNDGPSSLPVNDPKVDLDKSFDYLYVGNVKGMNNKFSMLSGYEYTMVFRPVDLIDFRKNGYALLEFQFAAENLGEVSPVMKAVGLGQQCQVAGAQAVNSIDAVRSANGPVYFSSGNEIWFRLKTKDRLEVTTGATSSQQSRMNSYIHCDANPKPQVIGYYDLTVKDGKGTLAGWACDQTVNESIDLHIYVGSEVLGVTRGNLISENQVLASCGAYKGNYRFTYQLSSDQIKRFAGKKVDVYGISKSGGPNPILTAVSSVVIPQDGNTTPVPAPTPIPNPSPTPPSAPVCKNTGSFGSGSSMTDYACDCSGKLSAPWVDVGGGCYHRPYQEKFFCTAQKTKTYFRCGMGNPGAGWNDAGGGCYHRGTTESCP